MNALVPADDWSKPTEYERWYDTPLGRAYRESLERVIQPWLTGSSSGKSLDVGCGPGLALERLFPPCADVWNLDCSPASAWHALARVKRLGRTGPVLVGSVERIPIADETFDTVLSMNCLEFVANREAAFGEIARVLRPGGVAILALLNRRGPWEWARRVRRPFSRKSYYRGRFYTRNEITALCEASGLSVEAIVAAVRFPPWNLGVWMRAISVTDRVFGSLRVPCGGVMVCRARKRPG